MSSAETPSPQSEPSVSPASADASAPESKKGEGKPRKRNSKGGGGKKRGSRRETRDFGPPKFNVEELEALTGPALWQASHEATVKDVTEAAIFVEIKVDGKDPVRAAISPTEFQTPPSVGTTLRVWLGDPPKAQEGEAPVPSASVLQANDVGALDAVRAAFAAKERMRGVIVGEVKGGFAVALGVESREAAEASTFGLRAFLPRSQASLGRFGARGSEVVGIVDDFDITELDLDRANIVVSRKAKLQAERKEVREQTWAKLEEGAKVVGRVKAIMPYGAFVDIGGVDGLIHQSDLSWDRQPRVKDVLSEGQELEFVVVLVDKEKKKLKLGLKQLTPDPWAEAREKIVPGNDIEGVVVALADFGAFLKVLDGVEGLIHISEISYDKIKHPSQRFEIGQEVKARILEFDVASRRVSLSTKALEANPWEAVAERFPVGTVLKANVKSLADFGAFIEIDGNVDGMIHVGEISWTEHIQHPSEALTIGEEVEVVVLRVDVDKHRVACSIKQTKDNPFERWEKDFAPGKRMKLKVTRVTEMGAVFDLDDGLHAFCHKRELSDEPVARAVDVAKQGDEIEVEVKRFDRRRKRVDVSAKAVVEGDTKAAYDEYKKREGDESNARVTLASQLQDALNLGADDDKYDASPKKDADDEGPVRTQAVGEAPGEDPGYDPSTIATEEISDDDDNETDADGNPKSS